MVMEEVRWNKNGNRPAVIWGFGGDLKGMRLDR
jgi:hypothetical protein